LALVGRFGRRIIEQAIDLMGFENLLIATPRDLEIARALLDRLIDQAIPSYLLGLEYVGRYIQIFKASGDDLVMQTGPLSSPRTFTELILQRLRRCRQVAHAHIDTHLNPSLPVMFHTGGSVRAFILQMIDAGLQALTPAQPGCARMELSALKREFGDRVVFHDGIDVHSVLPFGTQNLPALQCAMQSAADSGRHVHSLAIPFRPVRHFS
jgi:uroporphyrinogen decarboxylase